MGHLYRDERDAENIYHSLNILEIECEIFKISY
jgi:hypothetical protein